MRIAIDLRSLQTGGVSGVENYTLNLLERLLSMDRTNQYVLFYNSFKATDAEHLHFINSTVVRKRVPNRILNTGLKFFNTPKFERFLGDFDVLFLPNMNHFALGPSKKLVVTVHDLSPVIFPEFYDTKRRLWHASLNFKKICQRADLLIAVSEFTKHDLIDRFGIPKHKIRVVHNGIDHSVFKPALDKHTARHVRNKYSLPGEYILFLGTLEPRKNIPGLIGAFNELKGSESLVIAGRPGWKYHKILEKIRQSPRRRYIVQLGYVEEVDKPHLVRMARTVAFPSFYEGFGFPVLEAMSCGVPVVTSQLTSLPEVAGSAALLVNPYNTGDLVRALTEVLHDDQLRDRLVAKGLEQAKKFSWQKTAEQTLAALNELV